MAECGIRKETFIARAITLFPSDTVLAALQVMHQHGLTVLPVVDEERGELIAEVTEAELCRVAARLPLIGIAEVLTAKAMGTGEGMTGPASRPVNPAPRSAPRWLH
ncbi:MAG TPA: CBS domain-containing protein [Myxococcaceae bacterium]